MAKMEQWHAMATASFTSASFSGIFTDICMNLAMLDAEAIGADSILDWCSLVFSCRNRFDFRGFSNFLHCLQKELWSPFEVLVT